LTKALRVVWAGKVDSQYLVGCQCRHKTPAELPTLPIGAALSLGGDAVATLQ